MFYEAYRGKWLCPILYKYFLVFSQFLVKAISGRVAVGLKRDCRSSHLTNAFSLATFSPKGDPSYKPFDDQVWRKPKAFVVSKRRDLP